MLISQHNALLGEEKTLTGMVGTIDQKCDILAVCEDAYQAAAVLCDREYLDHPELKSFARDTTDDNLETQGKVSTSYVPAHLHHIMFEIFKVFFSPKYLQLKYSCKHVAEFYESYS